MPQILNFLFAQYAVECCIFLACAGPICQRVVHHISCFPRADAARQALDKAREEEYNKRVGLCGVRIEHVMIGI